MHRRLLSSLLCCVAVTACGSTVQGTGASGDVAFGAPATGAVVAGDGLGGSATNGGTDGSTVPAASGGSLGTIADSPAGGGNVQAGSPGAAAGGEADTTQSTAVAGGPRKPVQVGFVLFPDANEAARQVFGQGGEDLNQEALVRTTVNAVNAAGGLAGHPIAPVFHEVPINNSKPYSQMYQEICEKFTKDNKVVATVIMANAHNDLPLCLAKGGSAYFASGHFIHDAQDYREVPSMVTSSEAAAQRAVPELVSLMLARDAIKRGEKVGVLHMDYGAARRTTTNVLKPLLEKQGVELLTYEVPYPKSTTDIANSAAVVQSAVLRFAAEGVKTVTFLCPGCFTFFVQYADSQGYYPRYAVTSYDTLNINRSAHSRSLANAIAMGWEPLRDVGGFSDREMLNGNPTYRTCRKLHEQQIRDDSTALVALTMCGLVRDLQASASKIPAGAPLTFRSIVEGAGRLGTSHAFPGNFSTTLQSDRHDGSSSYRLMRFDPSRGVFRYETTTQYPLR